VINIVIRYFFLKKKTDLKIYAILQKSNLLNYSTLMYITDISQKKEYSSYTQTFYC